MKMLLIKNSMKEIKNNFKRFLSLLLIAMLGVGFFAGLKAASPDMKKTIDLFFDDTRLFDIKVLSTLGLTDEDIEALEQIENVEKVYGSYSEDVYVNVEEKDYVIQVIELNDEINLVEVMDGRLPENSSECVIEDSMAENLGLSIGDYIELKEDLGEDEDSSFYETNVKIVGTVESPLFISTDKGTSTLGAGKLEYYMYVPASNIHSDIYTEIYAVATGALEMDTSSDEYAEYIDGILDDIKDIKTEREEARYNSLIDEANEKLDDAQQELDDAKAEGEQELADAYAELIDGENTLADSEKEYEESKADAEAQIAEAEATLTSSQAELDSGKAELESQKATAETQFAEAEATKEELELNLDKVVLGLEELNANYQTVCITLNTTGISDEQKQTLIATKEYLESQIEEYGNTQAQLTAAIEQIETEVAAGKAQIAAAEAQIASAEAQIASGWSELNSQKATAEEEFAKAEAEIEDAKKEIADGWKEYYEGLAEFDEEIADAENKLIDARQEVEDIETATWYIYGRNANTGYESYLNDADNIAQIANVFPFLFFFIAILISLTSMTRMVEEQRVELGTMKALGYKNSQILIKYFIYATLATVIGSLIGMCIGFRFLPAIVFNMYQLLYKNVTNFVIEFNTYYAVLGLGSMLVCVLGATMYSAIKELMAMPANLMRPKSPKAGKRVLIEKVHFIWNHLSFTWKVTLRNMFRYKKRFLMTIVGITGCTALIIVGFGLKDSIGNLLSYQYDDVYNYDLMITLKSSLLESEIDELTSELDQNENITGWTEANIASYEATSNNSDEEVDIQLIVPKEDGELAKVINLRDADTYEDLELDDDTVFITEKASELIDVQVGDTFILTDSDSNEYEVTVGGVVENYVYHYVYMSDALYEKVFGEDYKTNLVYLQTVDMTDDEEDSFNQELLDNSKVSSLTTTEYVRSTIERIVSALNSVVYILIICAGLLAFVVLYNLSNVNISERKREIATIKVLGFFDKEVYDYITKESILLSIIGIGLGLVCGYFLNGYVLKTCEVDLMRFKSLILPISYVYAVVLTVIFTVIVNIMTYFSLRKVDMIESLKSVE